MSKIDVMVIVEGQTEQKFIKDVLSPYLANKSIFVYAALIGKPGHKGGNVRFARVKNDIAKFLKQRSDTFVTLFVDYYRMVSDWPGVKLANNRNIPRDIANSINSVVKKDIVADFSEQRANERFIPYVAIHEFETLLFSDSQKLSIKLGVDIRVVDDIIAECKEPEKINNSTETAPSKRLEKLFIGYKKTVTGVALAREIGIEKMREQCPVFNDWLTAIEAKVK